MKVLKRKVGEVYIDGNTYPVMQTYWEKTSKDGKTKYFEASEPMFVNTVQEKPKEKTVENDSLL